ncbi:Hypothetical predicted protein [Scomber scombrus]|uniref:Uncharacterized protein n=1 Tax=Scomber scombrus TaxID=13677 RepID=A0AAV1QB64_SCOSC
MNVCVFADLRLLCMKKTTNAPTLQRNATGNSSRERQLRTNHSRLIYGSVNTRFPVNLPPGSSGGSVHRAGQPQDYRAFAVIHRPARSGPQLCFIL